MVNAFMVGDFMSEEGANVNEERENRGLSPIY